jgi:hypothetical protein
MKATGRLCASIMDTLGPEIVVLNRCVWGQWGGGARELAVGGWASFGGRRLTSSKQ